MVRKQFLLISIFFLCVFFGFVFSQENPCVKLCFRFNDSKGIKFPKNIYIVIDPGHGATAPKDFSDKTYSAGTGSRGFAGEPSDVEDEPAIAERV